MELKRGKRPIPPIPRLVLIPQGRLCARNSAEKRCLREAGALSKSMKTRQKNLFHDNALFLARAWIPRTTWHKEAAISFFNVACETVYHDLFLFIWQKRE